MAKEEPPDSPTGYLVRTGRRKLLARDEEVNAPLRFALRELTTLVTWSPMGLSEERTGDLQRNVEHTFRI